MEKTILITGGAGFIGSHLVRHFVTQYPKYRIINVDALTYAGNLGNLKDLSDSANYTFIKGDITDTAFIKKLFNKYLFHGILHLAAESHVDRSIADPLQFIHTNIVGTANLLNAARKLWDSKMEDKLFYHISTDEVYGSLGQEGYFTENTPYDPRSPYSASKASSDHLVRAWFHTYNMPVIISNCSNNYGSFQFPEKLIPLVINNIKKNKPLPIYGEGQNVRDWLFVEDHVRAIDLIFHKGKLGETYNIGGSNEWSNLNLVKEICAIMDRKLGRPQGASAKQITFVKDRAGHDLRYAIDSSKLQNELGWKPSLSFTQGLEKTIDWYLTHDTWLENIVTGDYQKFYEEQYIKR